MPAVVSLQPAFNCRKELLAPYAASTGAAASSGALAPADGARRRRPLLAAGPHPTTMLRKTSSRRAVNSRGYSSGLSSPPCEVFHVAASHKTREQGRQCVALRVAYAPAWQLRACGGAWRRPRTARVACAAAGRPPDVLPLAARPEAAINGSCTHAGSPRTAAYSACYCCCCCCCRLQATSKQLPARSPRRRRPRRTPHRGAPAPAAAAAAQTTRAAAAAAAAGAPAARAAWVRGGIASVRGRAVKVPGSRGRRRQAQTAGHTARARSPARAAAAGPRAAPERAGSPGCCHGRQPPQSSGTWQLRGGRARPLRAQAAAHRRRPGLQIWHRAGSPSGGQETSRVVRSVLYSKAGRRGTGSGPPQG